MYRGDIVKVELPDGEGSEQGGYRPCVIVQNNVGNRHSPTTIICPITKRKKHFNATHVEVNCLPEPSVILCEQVRVIDKKRIKYRTGKLSEDIMLEVDEKLLLSLGIEIKGEVK